MIQSTSPAQPEKGGLFERASDLLAKGSLVAMMLVIGMEMVLRNTIHYSWEGTDETSSYLVVALTFFSLATCQLNHGYHELELVKGRLSPRGRALLDAVMHTICLLCALILLWHFCRLVGKSWSSGETSATALRVPYWIPQLSMPLGMAAFCISIAKSVRNDLAAFKRRAARDDRQT